MMIHGTGRTRSKEFIARQRNLASCIGSLDGRQSNRVGKEAEVGQRTHVKNDRTGIPARPVFSRIVLIV